MQLLRLGPLGSTAYIPDDLIEGYSSLIWTERGNTPGDFELRTPKVDEFRTLMPEGLLISELDSTEVMMVEDHEITISNDGYPELIVRGRTVDMMFEHRHIEAPYKKKRKMAREYTPIGAAAVIMWNAIDNTSDVDVTRSGGTNVATKDRIPNVMITDSVVDNGSLKRWWLKEGPVYPQLADILVRWDLNLRTIRPNDTTGTAIRVKTGSGDRGDIERTVHTDIGSLRFDLYQGLDRTGANSNIDPVVLNVLHGDIDNAKYLFSIKDYKTACEIVASPNLLTSGADIYRNSTEAAYSGWNRRVMSYEGGEPELPAKPREPTDGSNFAQWNAYNALLQAWEANVAAIENQFVNDLVDDALRALKRQRKVSLFTGDVSLSAPYQYRKHYFLGDKVRLQGAYGQLEDMIVSEYIRTEDSDGDRGYPGLTLP